MLSSLLSKYCISVEIFKTIIPIDIIPATNHNLLTILSGTIPVNCNIIATISIQ